MNTKRRKKVRPAAGTGSSSLSAATRIPSTFGQRGVLEKYMILTRGFQNVVKRGKTVGFQMLVRIPYYRGVTLALVGGFEVTVDGKKVKRDRLRFTLEGRTYTMDQIGKEEKVRWPFGEPATLTVLKPGGLTPGIHNVELVERIVPSYMGPAGFSGRAEREMTLVGAPTAAAASSQARIRRGVSLYSYQEAYFTREMSLDDCVAEVASLGAEGVELLPEEMTPNYPNPPASWVEHWHGLMKTFHTKPACMDTFVDVNLGGHREMTVREAVNAMVSHFKLAKRLGFKRVRATPGRSPHTTEILRAAIRYAEQYDMKIAIEMHAGPGRRGSLKGEYLEGLLDLMIQTKTKHLGFTLDMGVLATRLPRVMLDHYVRQGASKKIIRYIDSAFMKGYSHERIQADVRKMGGKEPDLFAAWRAGFYGPVDNKPKDLQKYMPYIYNIHGKFWEMTSDLKEFSIPYDKVIPVIVRGGYQGYINSEFEGQRFTLDAFETNECEQVRRHQLMLKRLLA